MAKDSFWPAIGHCQKKKISLKKNCQKQFLRGEKMTDINNKEIIYGKRPIRRTNCNTLNFKYQHMRFININKLKEIMAVG